MRKGQRIQVETVASLPKTLRDSSARHEVQTVLDVWREGGRWWVGESPGTVFLLELTSGRIVTIEERTGAWFVESVHD